MDDRLDIRQRRAIATSHSYPESNFQGSDSPSMPSTVPCAPFPTLTSRWRARRVNAQLPLRLGMRLIEVASLALAMLLIPSLMQYVVRSVDEMHEIVGRRSRSPFGSVSGSKVLVGAIVFVAWHVVILGLGYVVLIGHEKEDDRIGVGIVGRTDALARRRDGRTSASRILGRVLLPSYLGLALLFLFYQLSSRLLWPTFAASTTDGYADGTAPPSLR
jgi:hypothetical protein